MNTSISSSIPILNNSGTVREDARSHAATPSSPVGGNAERVAIKLATISSESGTAEKDASNNANAPAVSNTAGPESVTINIEDAVSAKELRDAATSPRSVTSAPITQR
jgi:hypothetical protein